VAAVEVERHVVDKHEQGSGSTFASGDYRDRPFPEEPQRTGRWMAAGPSSEQPFHSVDSQTVVLQPGIGGYAPVVGPLG